MNNPYQITPDGTARTSQTSNFNTWLLASRPKTLWAGIAPVLMGSSVAFADGVFHWASALAALLCAILIQVGTNFANDYFDFVHGADTTERLGPTRATQAGLVKPGTMKKAFIVTFSLAFIIGIYLIWRGGWPILMIGVFSILFGILYTGGPYPLGYNGLGDIFVLIFFGPVAVGGTYYVQALQINYIVLPAGLAPGLISVALLTVNNLRDINTDRNSGKRTLAVRFGANFARMEYLFCIVAACLLPAGLSIINGGNYYSAITIFVLLFALPGIKTVFRESGSPVLNEVLARTGKMLLIYSMVFSIGWII
jgi:1,4-dihydroxy-2-naphthoate octaprenyltransferase